MDFTINFDRMPDYVLIQTEGVVEVAEFNRLMAELTSSPRWVKGTPQIVDHRKLDMDRLRSEDMQRIRLIVESYRDRLGEGKAAFVVGSRAVYGFARMYELVGGREIHGDLAVVDTIEDAARWLGHTTEEAP